MKENGFKLTKEISRRYPAQTITEADSADDIAIRSNSLAQAETLLHSLERVESVIGFHVNADKIEYMCFNQRGDISTLKGGSSETSGQVNLPRKKYLINREWHQQATSKGMNSHW